MFHGPKRVSLVVAGSVQGLTTLAPRVLSQAHACACACDDCDTLAQRLNQKLQLGQNHCLFFCIAFLGDRVQVRILHM